MANNTLTKIIPIIRHAFAAVMAVLFAAVILAFGLAVPERPAHGMASGWAVNDQGRLRMVSAVDGVGDRSDLPIGLQFRLQPGWKIYWRSPGDAGFPPQVDWSGSQNLGEARIAWPAPSRFSVLGFESVGYKDEVVLPVRVSVADPGKPVRLQATVIYLTCAEICVPQEAKLALHLPDGPAAPSPQANMLARYDARLPGDGARHGLAIARTAISAKGEDLVLDVRAAASEPFMSPDLFVEGPDGIYFSPPKVSYSADRRTVDLKLDGGGVPPGKLEGATIRLTLVDGERSMEHAVPVRLGGDIGASPLLPLTGAATDTSLLSVLLLALIGGLILNLMPCVLPVLSIKLLKVVGHGGADRGAVRSGFLASAAGILFSFLVLASFLVGLKAAGMSVGWGIQFQQPAFLVAMAAVLTLFACNLFGLFEFRLPDRFANWAAGQGSGRSLAGHFMTGALATLLATPCSAPFLGTAVGFALSRGAIEIYAIFVALGVGLAIPYLLVAGFPALASVLPRPGAWMATLRRIMAVALAGTAVWLLSILHVLSGGETTIVVGALLLLIPAVYAARRVEGTRIGRHAGVVTILLVAAAVAMPLWRGPVPESAPGTAPSTAWQRFDEAAIAGLVRDGKVVLVDVSADWCITCKVNKSIAFDQGPVESLIAGPAVVAMRADWTKPNPEIARYLARFGRYGIPFDVVYGPRAPQGILLPELLTPNAVLDAIAGAATDKSIVSR